MDGTADTPPPAMEPDGPRGIEVDEDDYPSLSEIRRTKSVDQAIEYAKAAYPANVAIDLIAKAEEIRKYVQFGEGESTDGRRGDSTQPYREPTWTPEPEMNDPNKGNVGGTGYSGDAGNRSDRHPNLGDRGAPKSQEL